MVETVDTRCELPQAQLFEGRQLEDSGRQPLNDPVWTDEWYQFAASRPHTEIFQTT